MTCSAARMAANQANSLKAKGPTSDAGKTRSRSNALTHGLTAKVLRTPEEEAELGPTPDSAETPVAEWIQAEVALLVKRIRRAQETEERERDRGSLRADACWAEDRGRDADQVARGLKRRPDRVVRTLRGTNHGCAWLAQRWAWLRDAARAEGGWTAEHQELASQLRGIPESFRGAPVAPGAQARLAESQIQELERLGKTLNGCDAFERESARRRLSDEATPELRRVIRYEAALMRRLQWCVNQLRPANSAVPRVSAKPKPVPAPTEVRDVAPPIPREERIAPLPDRLAPLPGSTLGFAMIPAGSRPGAAVS